jgi:hypothetical protein
LEAVGFAPGKPDRRAAKDCEIIRVAGEVCLFARRFSPLFTFAHK